MSERSLTCCHVAVLLASVLLALSSAAPAMGQESGAGTTTGQDVPDAVAFYSMISMLNTKSDNGGDALPAGMAESMVAKAIGADPSREGMDRVQTVLERFRALHESSRAALAKSRGDIFCDGNVDGWSYRNLVERLDQIDADGKAIDEAAYQSALAALTPSERDALRAYLQSSKQSISITQVSNDEVLRSRYPGKSEADRAALVRTEFKHNCYSYQQSQNKTE